MSQQTRDYLETSNKFTIEPRGKIEIKVNQKE